jgi:hypothetical protein
MKSTHVKIQEKIDAKNEEIKAINLRMSITEAKQTENQDLETDLIQQKYELSSLQVQLENRMKGLELKCKNGNDRRYEFVHYAQVHYCYWRTSQCFTVVTYSGDLNTYIQ